MCEGPFFRDDGESRAFRMWLDAVSAHVEKLPEGSFKESGTGVNARLVMVRKEA